MEKHKDNSVIVTCISSGSAGAQPVTGCQYQAVWSPAHHAVIVSGDFVVYLGKGENIERFPKRHMCVFYYSPREFAELFGRPAAAFFKMLSFRKDKP